MLSLIRIVVGAAILTFAGINLYRNFTIENCCQRRRMVGTGLIKMTPFRPPF